MATFTYTARAFNGDLRTATIDASSRDDVIAQLRKQRLSVVKIDQDELTAMPNIRLYPGMPATVMIPTVQRTAFEYIVGPLAMSFNSSFRQK